MSEDESSASPLSDDINERIRKRIKTSQLSMDLCPAADITDLAVGKYNEIKKAYNFTTFAEASKERDNPVCRYEAEVMPLYDFNQELYKFRRSGFCANTDSSKGYLFSSKQKLLKNLSQLKGIQITEDHEAFKLKIGDRQATKTKAELTKKLKEQRRAANPSQTYIGPWAGYGEQLQNGAMTQDQTELIKKAEERKKMRIEEAKKEEEKFEPSSIFHWKDYSDYKGKSYVDPPSEFKPSAGGCYLPKKQVHSWLNSQRAGYQTLRFFPKSGHFLLVANPEGKIQLYDVHRNRTCAHTYFGHTKAVRDIQFSYDGKHFLSAGFDCQVHYWDTEYGKVARTFKLKKIPFSVKFHPSPDRQGSFLCGGGNKKILQFDLNSGTKTIEYNQHLGIINTVTFIEEDKFVTTSDDKKIFIWEFGIPVVIKHVSEPEMHAVTATATHPRGVYFLGQSSDNQIVTYQHKDGNFRRLKSKKFASHHCAGYACSIDFSHDGQFLASGDERGRLVCYDWKTTKTYRTLDAHPSVCIGVQFHPSDPTMIATCGWEGLVKLWE